MNEMSFSSQPYLSEQIITYLGNKRSLLDFINEPVNVVKKELNKKDISTLDLFSGSGVVARYFKTFSSKVFANDLEGYSKRLNSCYLINKSEFDYNRLVNYFFSVENQIINNGFHPGFITEMYSPRNDQNIQLGERVFYTSRNAMFLDTVRQLLFDIPEPYQTLLLGPLLFEASVKTNTCGIFKAFYKNSETNKGQFGGNGRFALSRILSDIKLQMPVLSDNNCDYTIFQEDASILIKTLPHIDLAYLDPPYNQHPYSSNYFMLNLINEYKRPTIVSKVSGIPSNWNKSEFNKKSLALSRIEDICANISASYVLISFNSDGFVSKQDMKNMLQKYGNVRIYSKYYNTYRGSRNLKNRDLYVKEYLYLLKKGD